MPMAGIHLPDIGRLGIRIATGMRDKKRVGPHNMVEHARLKLLSERIDSEKKERHRELLKEQHQIWNKKKRIDYRRLQINKDRLNENRFYSDTFDKKMASFGNKTVRRSKKVKFPYLSLECKPHNCVITEHFDRGASSMLSSRVFLRTIKAKPPHQKIPPFGSLIQSNSSKLQIHLPSINEQRQHEPTNRASKHFGHLHPKERKKPHNLRISFSSKNVNLCNSKSVVSLTNKDEIFKTESQTSHNDLFTDNCFPTL